jgi:hypothetical protein
MANSLIYREEKMRSNSKQMQQAAFGLIAGVGLGIGACTSAKESNEFNAAVPTTIQSDADRRAIYNNAGNSAPISRPPNLNDQASEVNRQKNIEDRGVNQPHNKPLEVRTRELSRPVADTTR